MGHKAIFGDIFGCHMGGVSKVQGCSKPPAMARRDHTSDKDLAQNVLPAETEEPWVRDTGAGSVCSCLQSVFPML